MWSRSSRPALSQPYIFKHLNVVHSDLISAGSCLMFVRFSSQKFPERRNVVFWDHLASFVSRSWQLSSLGLINPLYSLSSIKHQTPFVESSLAQNQGSNKQRDEWIMYCFLSGVLVIIYYFMLNSNRNILNKYSHHTGVFLFCINYIMLSWQPKQKSASKSLKTIINVCLVLYASGEHVTFIHTQ